MKKLVSVFIYLLIAVLIAGTLFLLLDDQQSKQAQSIAAEELDEIRRPYLARQLELTTRLAQIDQEQQKALPRKMTLHFLFTEPDARIMTDVLPIMAQSGHVGTVAVSEAFFPGDAGCLTADEALRLLEQGWELCLSVDAGTDVPALLTRLQAAGLPAPTTAYFPEGDCTLARESELSGLGFTAAVQYGRSQPVDGAAAALWFACAYGTLDDANGEGFDNAYYAKSAFVVTEGWQRDRELFSQSDLKANIDLYDSYVKLDYAQVMTIAAARLHNAEVEAARIVSEQEWESERDALNRELALIERTLQDLGNGQ